MADYSWWSRFPQMDREQLLSIRKTNGRVLS